ncbi:MAG: malate dehydrogenase [Patescibacteria group bacterium]
MNRDKISIIGAGNVGATAALHIAQKGLGDIVLFDVVEGRPQGVALDLSQSSALAGFDVKISGTNDYADTAGSDLVIITAGIPRKPGMTREDVMSVNSGIVSQAAEQVAKTSPDAIILVVTNPLDAMCFVAWKKSGFPKERVLGMAGVLDTSRFRFFAAQEIGVSAQDVEALVLGSHGDEMVPVISAARVGGVPLATLLSSEKIDALVERTRQGGAEIVGLLKTGSAYYAPGLSIAEMADSILNDRKRLLPCSCLVQGEFGLDSIFIGVPAILSRNGVEKIVELELTDNEKLLLAAAAEKIKNLQDGLGLS